MLTQRARAVSSRVLTPFVLRLERLGVTPNTVTVLGTSLHVVVAWLLVGGNSFAAGLALAFAASFDAVDGTLARATGRESHFGSFLDSTLDRVSEVILFAGMLFYFGSNATPWQEVAIVAGLSGSLMVSYTRARAEGLGYETTAGVFDRLVRMVVLILALLTGQVMAGAVIVAVGSWSTTAMRVLDVKKHTSSAADAA